MSDSKQTGSLVLSPAPAATPPARETLLSYLAEVAFIGAALDDDPGGFLIGERFLQMITFMGCSPHIELAPPANGGSFCHVRLGASTAHPVLLAGRNAQPPRCPRCRGRIDGWRDALDAWREQTDAPIVHCIRCGTRSRPMDLDWRRQAGCGRLLLEVTDVFPGEAVPVSALLRGLEGLGAGPWRYFYFLRV